MGQINATIVASIFLFFETEKVKPIVIIKYKIITLKVKLKSGTLELKLTPSEKT